MVIKVRRYRAGCHIICWMLHWREGVNVLTDRKYDDSARMLTGGSLNTGTASNKSIDLALTLMLIMLLVIILYITKCSFLGKGTNCTGSKGLTSTEDNLRVGMRLTLIFTREVQVDIRLLITVETKECLEWNIVTILCQLFAADRTDLIGHITACASGKFLDILRIKITVVTFLTVIMRAEWIDLGDTGHRRNK
jgi:hypothetical protein